MLQFNRNEIRTRLSKIAAFKRGKWRFWYMKNSKNKVYAQEYVMNGRSKQPLGHVWIVDLENETLTPERR